MRKFFLVVLSFIIIGYASAQSIHDILTVEEKVYGLSKIWQEVNYNFAFIDRLDFDFDSLYRATIPKVIEAKDNFEYINILSRFMGSLGDGHTSIMFSQFYWDEGDYPPIVLDLKNDRFYVSTITEYLSEEIPPGSELLMADGIPYADFKTSSPSGNLFGYLNTSVRLKFKAPDGRVVEKDFLRNANALYRQGKLSMVPKSTGSNNEWKEFRYDLDGGISIVEVNTFQSDTIVDQFNQVIEAINQSKGLIVDVRENGGGNGLYAEQLAKHLVNREYVVTESWKTRIHNAAKKAWNEKDFGETRAWEVNPPDTVLVGRDIVKVSVPIVILMGKNTFSAAEDFLIYTLGNNNIVRIGQNSAGSSGQPLFFNLPGGISARVCAKRDALPDGTEYIGIGIKPDIMVDQDEDVLKYAMKYLQGN